MNFRNFCTFPILLLAASALSAQQPKPVSADDQQQIETLLKNFDPNSYSLKVPVTDASGKTTVKTYGKAVGLASMRQTSVERNLARGAAASTNTNNNVFKVGAAASTNTNNNVFRVASTNTNNNIFKVGSAASTNTNNNIFKNGAAASTNTNNNVFKNGAAAATNTNNNIFVNKTQEDAARQLNSLLQKQYQ